MQYKNINFTELNNMKKLRKFSSKFQLQNTNMLKLMNFLKLISFNYKILKLENNKALL